MLKLTIKKITRETDQCKTFQFITESKVDYEPGQFLTFLFYKNGKETRRSYSMSSSPFIDEDLAITIKATSNGEISRWWMLEAMVGDVLNALLPSGMFTITPQKKTRDIFLAAAGSGITPVFSIIKSLVKTEPTSHIILIYSNSNPSTAIFLEELQQMEDQYSNQLKIVWLFSNHKNLLYARLSTYNLQRIILEQLRYKMNDAIMYTCGPFSYMQMVQITCLTMGFLKTNFRRELFDINELPPLSKRYYDTMDRTVTISCDGISYSLLVPYKQTILEAALKKGIDLPYSCKAGRCSTCRCKVVSGKVWMHYNEVLTDEDEEMGIALTCTGHPASDKVMLEI